MAMTAEAANKVIVYQDAAGQEVKLSPNTIKAFLVNGDKDRVTEQEVVMFLNLCRYQRLNPFLREAHLIKYGNSPATMVVGKDVHLKRAQRNKRYEGLEAGIVVIAEGEQELVYRTGSLKLPQEKIVGGWAKVYVSGFKVPFEAIVSFDEYVGRKSNGEINTQWSTKPGTMIRKVAVAHALREAFPDDLGALYGEEEMGVDLDAAEAAPILPQGSVDQEEIVEETAVPEQKTLQERLEELRKNK